MATPRSAAARRLAVLAILSLTLTRPATAQVTVTTVAGSGTAGWQDGPAAQAEFDAPEGLAIDAQGSCYVVDTNNNNIRLISSSGAVTTIAGNSGFGYFDHPNGLLSEFSFPFGIALDAVGNVYVADGGNGAIRKITFPGGGVTTWAGNGTRGYQDGVGAAARFDFPTYLVVDAADNFYVVDTGNHRIRYITATANVSTFAGSGIRGTLNGPAASAQFEEPQGIARDISGNIYIADRAAHRIRKLTPAGLVTTYAGTGIAGYANGPALQAQFSSPIGLAIDATGILYVAERDNHRIRCVDAAGNVSTLAGTGLPGYADGPAAQAQFNSPYGLCLAPNGRDLYVADAGNNRIRRLTLGPLSTAGPSQQGSRTLAYPNPANSSTVLHFATNPADAVAEVQLTTPAGKVLRTTTHSLRGQGASTATVEVALTDLPPGTYLYRIITGSAVQQGRIVKN